MRVDEHTIEVAGTPAFYRSASVPSDIPTPVYLHGVPSSSDDWTDLLERTGGVAPDLIGFGRSGKGGHLEYSVPGLASFVGELVSELGVERVSLVGHEWGAAAGLALARRRPELVERVALCNPLLSGGAGHGLAAMLRRPVAGELIMGATPRWLLARTLRRGGYPDERIGGVWEHFDQGTQRAILRLYRAGGPGEGQGYPEVPTLVVWGEPDPWLPSEFADRIPGAEIVRIADAGHWPWLQSSDAADRIADWVLR